MTKLLITIAAAAAAAGAGAAFLAASRKAGNKPGKPAEEKAKPAGASGAKKEKAAPVLTKTASYSFLAGVQNALPVELTIGYDDVNYDYAILTGDYPSFSSNEQVGLLSGADVSLQIEYADIYDGSSFDDAMKVIGEKYNGLAPVTYGTHSGYKYINGDCMSIALPIDGVKGCYVLITLIKGKGSDVEFTELPDLPDVVAMISSVKTAIF